MNDAIRYLVNNKFTVSISESSLENNILSINRSKNGIIDSLELMRT